MTEHYLNTCVLGAGVKIGPISVIIYAPAREIDVLREISDLYEIYPKELDTSLSDVTVSLQYTSLFRSFFGRNFTAHVNGKVPFQAMDPRLAVPGLESSINWFVGTSITRFLLLHSAVVERSGKALLLAGPSGAGKSTLCAALITRGWRLLSDEAAMIRPDDGLIQPYPRPICLKNASIDLIAEAVPDAHISKRYEGTTKGTVAFMRAPLEAIDQAEEAARPGAVVFLRYSPMGRVALEPVEKAPAFMALVDQSANYATMLEKGFDTLAGLVEACDHYNLFYRSLDDALGMIEQLEPAAGRIGRVA